MTFEEYKTIFEGVLALSEKIEGLCKNNRFEETDELFDKRNQLMAKLTLPDDIDEEKILYIQNLRDKIQEKNASILTFMQNERKAAEAEMKQLEAAQKAKEESSTEAKLKEEYKNPKDSMNTSIFKNKN